MHRTDDPALYVREDAETILFRWQVNDLATFDEIRADLRRSFPRSARLRFDKGLGGWALPMSERANFETWLRYWFSPACQYPWPPEDDETQAGRTRAQRGGGRSLAEAFALLHLNMDAPLWAAEAVYRAAQKHMHPDAGGTHAQATALNEAIALIREARQEHAGAA